MDAGASCPGLHAGPQPSELLSVLAPSCSMHSFPGLKLSYATSVCPGGVGRQQQHSALRALEMRFFMSFQPRSGLVPEAAGTTWGWSLGTSGSLDSCSSVKSMFTRPSQLPFRGGLEEEDSSARLSSDIMVTVVSPVAGLMVSGANASPSGAVLSG